MIGRRPRRLAPAHADAAAACVVALLLWLECAAAAITLASVTPTSSSAGATGTAKIAFTTGVTVPVGGSISVAFPAGFYVASTSITSIASGLDASSTIASTPATSLATITVATNPSVAGAIEFTINGISNPGEGTTGMYTIRTLTAGGQTIEVLSIVPGSVITKKALTGATLAPSHTNAGVAAAYTLSFTPSVDLRAGSQVEVQFPVLSASQYVLVPASTTVSGWTGISPASTTLQVLASTVRLTLAGATVTAGTPVAVTFGGVIHPAAQTTGSAFAIRTRDAFGNIYEEQTNVAGPTLVSTTLSSAAKLTPGSILAGNVTTYTVEFTNAAYLGIGSKIVVIFPARYSISGASLSGTTNIPSFNTVLTKTPALNVVTLTLGSGPLTAGAARTIVVKDVVNPGSACNEFVLDYCSTGAGSYTIRLTDSLDQVFEESTTVPETLLVKKQLTFGRVRPADTVANTATSVTVTFDSESTIPNGGAVEVVLPEGYVVSTAPLPVASALVGIPAGSTAVAVSGRQVTLTVSGASIPPTVGLSVRFSGITTPPGETTGLYTIRTRDAVTNFVIEESQSIVGEGCTYLNDCNGHGACTLFTKSCICNDGWGSPRDVTLYRSPACTTRVCPSGRSWAAIPSDEVTAHDTLEECSGMGVCDRNLGTCTCFPGFAGSACERLECPNNCNNRGACLSMRSLARVSTALPLSAPTTYSGALSTTTWDESRIFGCACDSAWAVGTGAGEIQATEYFGADCSKRHCPTGNDPSTDGIDETACVGKAAAGSFAVGVAGNLCLVECSNRGLCNYKTGTCQCFRGFTGYACQLKDALQA